MELTLEIDTLLLVGAVMALSAVFASAAITRRSRRFRISGALLFLVLGMAFGDDGLNLISLDDTELVQNNLVTRSALGGQGARSPAARSRLAR